MSVVPASIKVYFDRDEICEFVNNSELTDEQAEEIADVLIFNLESVMDHADSTVSIDRSVFNDSFYDMQEDLQERYGVVDPDDSNDEEDSE